MVRYLFYTIGDLTYQSPLVPTKLTIKSEWSEVLLEKLTVPPLLKKFPPHYAARRFFTVLSCDIPIVLDNMMVQGSTVEHI